ncbi:hypothetical protein [Streptomyces mirabilis]
MSRIRWQSGASTVTGSPSRQGGTTDPGTGEGAVSCAVLVTAIVSAADTDRASTSSSRAITHRSSSIFAASNTSANRATSSHRPSTRTRAAASRSSSIPSTGATAHPRRGQPKGFRSSREEKTVRDLRRPA